LRKEILIPGVAMLVIGLAMVGYTFLIPVAATGTLVMRYKTATYAYLILVSLRNSVTSLIL
jgi:hypothetical protein